MHARVSITVAASHNDVYRRWRDMLADDQSGLRMAPVEMADDEPPNRMGWVFAEDSPFRGSGVAVLAEAPGDQGVELHVDLEWSEGGAVGSALRKLTGTDAEQQARDDLRRFKQVVETGEIVRSQGTPEGHAATRHLTQQPAQ
jgi:uncharacterized membrane protein